MLIATIIDEPRSTASVLKRWIETSGESGLDAGAAFIRNFSPKLLLFLRDHFPLETFRKLQKKLDIFEEPPEEVIGVICTQFETHMQLLTVISAAQQSAEKLYAALEKMGAKLLYQLLRDLETAPIAAALVQLSPNQSAAVLKHFPREQKREIIGHLYDIDRNSIEAAELLRHALAETAIDLLSLPIDMSIGSKTVINLSDGFEDVSNSELIETIKLEDSLFSEKIQNKQIKYSDFLQAADNKLSAVVSSADRDLLATSLVHVSDEEVDRILASLPPELSEWIRASLEQKSKSRTK